MTKTNRMPLLKCLGLLCILTAFGANATARPSAKQAQEDWGELAQLVTVYQNELTSEYKFKENSDAMLEAWGTWKKSFTKQFASFKENYGATVDDVRIAFDGIDAPGGVNFGIVQAFGSADRIDVAAKEADFAKWALALGKDAYTAFEFTLERADPAKVELRLKQAEEALKWFEMAEELNPEGDYGDYLKPARKAVKEAKPALQKALKEQKWPGHNPDFGGPGNPGKLAEAALDYLRKADQWSKPEYDDVHTPVAACVTASDWEVSKKTPLGQPTQYSLNVFVAFKGEKDPKIAYVYHMVFYTREEAGVDKRPPFRYANSRLYASSRMLLSNVKGGGGGGGSKPVSGFFGFMWRLALAGSLVLAGLVAAGPALKVKFPQLSGVCDKLAPLRGPIGILALIVGVLAFLRAFLFYFSPLTDLLPQAAAIAIGLVLGKQILAAKMPQPTETSGADAPPPEDSTCCSGPTCPIEKAGVAMAKGLNRIGALERREIPLGWVALVLGLVHFLLGGWWLF